MLYKENMKVRHDIKKNRPLERGLLIYHLTSSPCLCVEHGENSRYFEGKRAGANIQWSEFYVRERWSLRN